jgi:hypothetical protein
MRMDFQKVVHETGRSPSAVKNRKHSKRFSQSEIDLICDGEADFGPTRGHTSPNRIRYGKSSGMAKSPIKRFLMRRIGTSLEQGLFGNLCPARLSER